MTRPYEYIAREDLERELGDFTARVHAYIKEDYSDLTGPFRREIRKINRELRRRDKTGDKG